MDYLIGFILYQKTHNSRCHIIDDNCSVKIMTNRSLTAFYLMSLASTDDLNWIIYHTEVQNDGLKFLIL